jgi:hypothetical protein
VKKRAFFSWEIPMTLSSQPQAVTTLARSQDQPKDSHHMLNFHPAGKVRKFRDLFPADLQQANAQVERDASRNCWLLLPQH